MSEPTPAHEPTEPDLGNRQRRRGAVLALAIIALVMGGYQGLRGVGRATAQWPLRFTMQMEPRPLPAIAFSDGDGRVMDLAQLRGKVILLNIWATWCPPCRKEMPSLDRLQGQLGGKDFEVVALSIDTSGAEYTSSRTAPSPPRAADAGVAPLLHCSDDMTSDPVDADAGSVSSSPPQLLRTLTGGLVGAFALLLSPHHISNAAQQSDCRDSAANQDLG